MRQQLGQAQIAIGDGGGLGMEPGVEAQWAALAGAVWAGGVEVDGLERAKPGAAGGAYRAARQFHLAPAAGQGERSGAQRGRFGHGLASGAGGEAGAEAGDLDGDGVRLGGREASARVGGAVHAQRVPAELGGKQGQ